MDRFVVKYPNRTASEILALGIIIPIMFLIMYIFIAYDTLFSYYNTFDSIILISVNSVFLIIIFSVFFYQFLKYKTIIIVNGNTIIIRSVFSEKEFFFNDITDAKCRLWKRHSFEGKYYTLKKRVLLEATIRFGKTKIEIDSRMDNAEKFITLLLKQDYLKKEDVDTYFLK